MFFLLLGLTSLGLAQETKNEEEIYSMVPKMPLFNNAKDVHESNAKLYYFVQNKLKSYNYQDSGIVYLSFIVDQEGSLKDFKIENEVSKELSDIAKDIGTKLTPFKPGENHFGKVNVKLVIPITFK